mgnify:FL=1
MEAVQEKTTYFTAMVYEVRLGNGYRAQVLDRMSGDIIDGGVFAIAERARHWCRNYVQRLIGECQWAFKTVNVGADWVLTISAIEKNIE